LLGVEAFDNAGILTLERIQFLVIVETNESLVLWWQNLAGSRRMTLKGQQVGHFKALFSRYTCSCCCFALAVSARIQRMASLMPLNCIHSTLHITKNRLTEQNRTETT